MDHEWCKRRLHHHIYNLRGTSCVHEWETLLKNMVILRLAVTVTFAHWAAPYPSSFNSLALFWKDLFATSRYSTSMDDKLLADRAHRGILSVPLPRCDQGGLAYPGDPACQPLSGPLGLEQNNIEMESFDLLAYHILY